MLADDYLIVTEDQLMNSNSRPGLQDVVAESGRSRPCKFMNFKHKCSNHVNLSIFIVAPVLNRSNWTASSPENPSLVSNFDSRIKTIVAGRIHLNGEEVSCSTFVSV
jgi:hypothetical protein